jgi:hypothetical protein
MVNQFKTKKMKKKNLLMTVVAIFGLASITSAQVPSYVPTSGLVGWWPFNGNANDESGNGNNGTVNGATLTTDRFGNAGQAYDFANANSISTSYSPTSIQTTSYSAWFLTTNGGCIIGSNASNSTPNLALAIHTNTTGYEGTSLWVVDHANSSVGWQSTPPTNPLYTDGIWHHIVGVFSCLSGSIIQPTNLTLYVDGQVVSTVLQNVNPPNSPINIFSNIVFGYNQRWVSQGFDGRFIGKLDDIGIWNRALTPQEITDLYNGCQLTVSSQPNSQTININNNAQFIVGSSDPSATFQWQTDLGVGFQNLNSVGQYSGTTNDTLTVSNVTMSNNNQPFRCIVSSGSCSDTSNVAVLTVNNNVGINEFTQDNLFSVFPNPAQSVINVKADNNLIGEVYTIYDNTGRVVLTGKINAQNTTIELGNLSGGIYMLSVGENMKQTFKVIKE